MSDFLEDLGTKLLLGDGPAHSVLADLGKPTPAFLPELYLSDPATAAAVHQAYIDAGSTLIRTLTREATLCELEKSGHQNQINELHWQAAQTAKSVARSAGAKVVGTVGEEGQSSAAYIQKLGPLLDGGADIILMEGFHDLEALIAALQAKQALHHCPAICTITWTPTLDVAKMFKALEREGAEVAGLCGTGPEFLEAIRNTPGLAVITDDLFPEILLLPEVAILFGSGTITPRQIAAAHTTLNPEG